MKIFFFLVIIRAFYSQAYYADNQSSFMLEIPENWSVFNLDQKNNKGVFKVSFVKSIANVNDENFSIYIANEYLENWKKKKDHYKNSMENVLLEESL